MGSRLDQSPADG